MKPRAVVLASGGMDSCVTAAIAHREYDLAMLHAQYGQGPQARERRAFDAIADHFGVARRLVVNFDHLSQIGGSSLTDDRIAVGEADLDAAGIPSSYVPFRNAHLLAVAVSWGEVLGAQRIFFGAVEEDSSGYPDCRQAFVDAFNRVIALGTKPDTTLCVETPLIAMSKADIVARGLALDAPLHLTWSCYRAEDVACGHCDSCALRLRGFFRAGRRDPIPYADEASRARYR